MNTITTIASTSTILAIDLGKYKSVVCIHYQASGEYRFTSFETTLATFKTVAAATRVDAPAESIGHADSRAA